MSDATELPRGACRIYRLTGLRCRDCPKRRAALADGTQPLRLDPSVQLDFRVFVRREKDNTGAPDSERFFPLGRQGTGPGQRPPSPPAPSGRCCEE